MSIRYILTITFLLFAAIGSWYLSRDDRPNEITQTSVDTNSGGFYLRGARILGTDIDGQLLYEIEAEYAEQKENKDIELQNVRINYSSSANVPWTINADAATISDSESTLRLSGHVIAVSNEGLSGQVTEIRAPVLNIDPGKYLAETDSRVQIRIGSRSLTATGMLALLQENRLQLISNVSGKFVP
ncbi:MAG: LPS export ABC transporter periplasmic protein LptC [Woeseiaceae bacterium]|jgi:lipopolysaccharide export system protein LptC|nr:LPS export ABC transporter periplasmic protein LptC [Woeseiaceae bacterium]|tara:strand:+ start:128 stop:685 length:558 start_codon:yes stop_codon:yes gene_type:complete